VPRKNAILAK